jgi:hypothetical protein
VSSTSPHGRSDWVTLLAGVRVSRAWMTRETPDLLAAWRDAPSPEHRRAIATRILQIATDLESEIDDVDDAAAEPALRELAIRIDTRLVHGPDWLPLAAALTRAATAGYDLAARLPALAAAAPLPARHPARELHWRLLNDCPAALPTLSPSSDSTVTAEGTPVAPTGPSRPQMSRDTPAIGRTDPASNQPTSQDRRSS